ncbi:MAG TPA: 50S ribosomal protein L24 [bacterium]|jgi:large subunit ribosomal protein L24|nr:50S ribosomal protein L24 [bacterium]
MNIKKNDQVKILAGKDKGKTGKVIQVFPESGRASVENINLLIKHLRPRKSGEKGQRVEFSAPMNLSNLMLICPKCNKPTRVGALMIKGENGRKGTKVRVCVKCKVAID